MSSINEATRAGWQRIADDVSRQRPAPGRRAHVFRGRNLIGRKVTILRHERDRFSDAFRYGGEANLHLREMMGRSGFVCLVRSDDGLEKWVKAQNLVCEHAYAHWAIAFGDAVSISIGWAPPKMEQPG
jgi:hypothetical protein